MNIYDLMEDNQVQVSLNSYSFRIVGESGVGKSPLYNVLAQKFNQEAGKKIVAIIPLEARYKHLGNLTVIRPIDKKTGLKKEKVETWEELKEIVDLLVKAKKDDPNFPIQRIGIDTTTKMEELAQQEVIRLNFQENGKLQSFNACFGGYGSPVSKSIEVSKKDVVEKLRNAGYIVDAITQARIKSQTDPTTGAEYQIISTDSGEKYDARTFLQDADISFFITKEEKVVNVGTTKQGKSINNLSASNKYLRLSSDGLYKGCKSPFVNVPELIDATSFEKAIDEYFEIFKREMSKSAGITNYEEKAKEEDAKKASDLLLNINVMKEDDKKEKRKDDIVKFIDYYDKMLNSLPSENIEQCNQYFNALMAESKKDNLLDALMAQSDNTLNMIYTNFGYNVGA
jgi:ABC-type oligopeptide transport system ATPase subunit